MKLYHPSPRLLGRWGEGKTQPQEQVAVWKSAPQRVPTVLPTGRFLAESKYKISKEEERPSLAWPLSARMSVSTYEEGKTPQRVSFQRG